MDRSGGNIRRKQMNDKPKIFVDGMFYSKPHPKAPDFILADIKINAEKFTKWLREHAKKETYNGNTYHSVRISVKESRNGKTYAELNNWQPGQKKQNDIPIPNPVEPQQVAEQLGDYGPDGAMDGDVPF